MAKYSKQKVSEQTQFEADKIATHIQKPGQTKEQTRLVAQGIQKGIVLYKKQQKAKARELDKKLKKASAPAVQQVTVSPPAGMSVKKTWLPWVLLGLSWLGFALLWVFAAGA